LNKSEIESVIESRPGGHELLRTDQRLLRLLGSGRHYQITADDEEILHLVGYSDEQLVEIKRVIDYAELNVKDIPFPNVTAAILRSFRRDNRVLLPPPTRRYLSPLSIEHLTSKIGLPIDAKDFEMPPANIIEHFLPKIGLILANEDDSDEFNGIKPHCLRLIFDFLEVADTLCQQIEDVISGLVQYLRDNQTDTGDLRHYLVRSLMNIIVKGTPEQEQHVVNEGGIPPLIRCLKSSKDSVVIAAVQALAKLATCKTKKHREKVLTTRTIPRFIELLDSKLDICVESSLSLLVTATKSHIGMSDRGLIPPLTRIMKSPSRLHVLPECSTLLRYVLEVDQPPIQDVIDAGILPTVIEIMNANNDLTVQANLAHVLIKLATSNQTGVIAKVDGLLSVLISLLDSYNDVTANESIVALGNIVQIAPEYRDLVVEAGVMKPLLHILKHSDKVCKLKVSTMAFSHCCCGKSTNLTLTKASLNVLTRLIVNDDIDVLRHACWALFHLLDGLQNEEVCSVMKTQYFLQHVIHLLKRDSLEFEQPILKSLHLITKVGCVDLIASCDGIAALSKILSSTHEENRNLACCTIGKLISGNSDRFQAVIDSNGVSLLFKIMTQKHNEKFALCVICEAVEVATPSQIKYLVATGCVKHMCAFLTTDVEAITGSIRNTEIAALRTLKKVSPV
jgi:importin subunit alpha-2